MKKGAFAPRSSLFGPDGPLARHWGAGFLPGVRAARLAGGRGALRQRSGAFSCRWAHSPLRHCSGVASHMSRMARSNRSGSWAMAPKLQLSKPVHASPSRLSVHHSSPPFTCWMNARSR